MDPKPTSLPSDGVNYKRVIRLPDGTWAVQSECCCGDQQCDLGVDLQIRFSTFAVDLTAERDTIRVLGGSFPNERFLRRRSLDFAFPEDVLVRFGQASVGFPFPRLNDIGADGFTRALFADCSSPSSSFAGWTPSRFGFYPMGTLTNYTLDETFNPFSGQLVTFERTEVVEIFGLAGAIVRNITSGDNTGLTSLSLRFVGCQTVDGANPQMALTDWIEFFFETSEPTAIDFPPDFTEWQDIPISTVLPIGCGPFAWSASNLSGRQYTLPNETTVRQTLFSWGGDGGGGVGGETAGVLPNNIVIENGNDTTTISHAIEFFANGEIAEHEFDTGGNSQCAEDFAFDCIDRPDDDGGGGGGGGGIGGGVNVDPQPGDGGDNFGDPRPGDGDPVAKAERDRQWRIQSGQLPGRCPSCGG